MIRTVVLGRARPDADDAECAEVARVQVEIP